MQLLITYSIYIFNEHFSIDAYSSYYEGFQSISLSNGRLVTYFIYKILDICNFRIYKNLTFNQIVCTFALALVSWKIYQLFSEALKEKEKQNERLLQIGILVLFINNSICELYYIYSELALTWTISVLLLYYAIYFWGMGIKADRRTLRILSYILLLLSINLYQMYVVEYIVICTIYLSIIDNFHYKKEFISKEFELLLITGIAAYSNIYVMKRMTSLGIIPDGGRKATFSITLAIRNLIEILKSQKYIWDNFESFLPKYSMLIIAPFLLVTVIYVVKYVENCIWQNLFFVNDCMLLYYHISSSTTSISSMDAAKSFAWRILLSVYHYRTRMLCAPQSAARVSSNHGFFLDCECDIHPETLRK